MILYYSKIRDDLRKLLIILILTFCNFKSKNPVFKEVVTVDNFLKLRKISGLSERSLEAAIKVLPRSLYGVHFIIDGAAIGIEKIVGDRALNFEIVNIAVDPKYQKQGFGRVIM